MTRQYIGARYVPKFFENQTTGDCSWLQGVSYEALTIVTYNNNSYTSKKPVPAGIGAPNLNGEYWVETGNFNAQLEQFMNILKTFEEVTFPNFEGEINADMNEFEVGINEQFTEYKNGLTGDFNTFKTGINNDISAFETAVNTSISEYESGNDNRVNGLQTQINNLVLEAGTSDAEVIQARGDYATLNARLNTFVGVSAGESGDLNSYLTNGLYYIPHDTTLTHTPADFGNSLGCFIFVYGVSNRVIQIMSPYSWATTSQWSKPKLFIRIYRGDSFTEWFSFLDTTNNVFKDYGAIGANTDLDNLTKSGSYSLTANFSTIGHLPPDAGSVGRLLVFSRINDSTGLPYMSTQLYFGRNQRPYYRDNNNGTWTSWYQFANYSDVQAILNKTTQPEIRKITDAVYHIYLGDNRDFRLNLTRFTNAGTEADCVGIFNIYDGSGNAFMSAGSAITGVIETADGFTGSSAHGYERVLAWKIFGDNKVFNPGDQNYYKFDKITILVKSEMYKPETTNLLCYRYDKYDITQYEMTVTSTFEFENQETVQTIYGGGMFSLVANSETSVYMNNYFSDSTVSAAVDNESKGNTYCIHNSAYGKAEIENVIGNAGEKYAGFLEYYDTQSRTKSYFALVKHGKTFNAGESITGKFKIRFTKTVNG